MGNRRLIPGFPKYAVTRAGDVFHVRTGRKLKPIVSRRGYHFYRLYIGVGYRESKLVFAHRIVAMTYKPNPKNKPQVAHRNHRKWDNRASNLKWVTDEENRAMNVGRDYSDVGHPFDLSTEEGVF